MISTKKTVRSARNATEVKTIDQLKLDLVAKQGDLIEAKRGNKLGELTNPRVITTTRKDIARLYTAIRSTEIASFTVTEQQAVSKGEI